MSKKLNNMVVLTIIGIILLLCSLPTIWFEVRDGVNLEVLGLRVSTGALLSVEITGLRGTLDVGTKIPLWLIVAIGGVGLGLLFLRQSRIADLPLLAPMVPWALSVALTAYALITALGMEGTTLGIGIFLAGAGLAVGGLGLFSPSRR
ncbi:MAG: hypothetical protein ACFCU3_01525 [Verrucomicrobiales bacterium]